MGGIGDWYLSNGTVDTNNCGVTLTGFAGLLDIFIWTQRSIVPFSSGGTPPLGGRGFDHLLRREETAPRPRTERGRDDERQNVSEQEVRDVRHGAPQVDERPGGDSGRDPERRPGDPRMHGIAPPA
jgi:hypothetical protein